MLASYNAFLVYHKVFSYFWEGCPEKQQVLLDFLPSQDAARGLSKQGHVCSPEVRGSSFCCLSCCHLSGFWTVQPHSSWWQGCIFYQLYLVPILILWVTSWKVPCPSSCLIHIQLCKQFPSQFRKWECFWTCFQMFIFMQPLCSQQWESLLELSTVAEVKHSF